MVVTEDRRRYARGAALSTFALLVVVSTLYPVTNNDIFLHLTTGKVVLESRSIPRVDDYSALAHGSPYIAHEWLAAVTFRLVEQHFSLEGLIVLKVVVALAVAATLSTAAQALGAAFGVALPLLALAMTVATYRFEERPHLFTFLLGAAFVALLARRRRGARMPLALFLPLQVVWANLHGGFVLGPAIVALAAMGEAADGFWAARIRGERLREHRTEALRLAALALALIAASALNPLGVRLLRFPFELTSASQFMGAVFEWLPPFGSRFAQTYVMRYYLAWTTIGAAVWLATLAAAWRKRRLPPVGFFGPLLFGAFFVLSLRMNRNVADFALVTFPSVAAAITSLLANRVSIVDSARIRMAFAFALCGLALAVVIWGVPLAPTIRRRIGLGIDSRVPVGAANFLAARNFRGNVFTDYESGAYLVYRLYPAVRVAMDSRNDVYGEELFVEFRRALRYRQVLRRMLERMDADAVCVKWPDPGAMVSMSLLQLGGWRLAFVDHASWLFLRDERSLPKRSTIGAARPKPTN